MGRRKDEEIMRLESEYDEDGDDASLASSDLEVKKLQHAGWYREGGATIEPASSMNRTVENFQVPEA